LTHRQRIEELKADYVRIRGMSMLEQAKHAADLSAKLIAAMDAMAATLDRLEAAHGQTAG
tara:strand:+ start:87 stop:266 length:180 start_codon:yes stop_codon:yes gene_type:complete